MTVTTVWCDRCQIRGRNGVLSHHLGIRLAGGVTGELYLAGREHEGDHELVP